MGWEDAHKSICASSSPLTLKKTTAINEDGQAWEAWHPIKTFQAFQHTSTATFAIEEPKRIIPRKKILIDKYQTYGEDPSENFVTR